MKNEMALKYLKALSSALAKKNTAKLLKPKSVEVEAVVEDKEELAPDELSELLGLEKEEDEEEALITK